MKFIIQHNAIDMEPLLNIKEAIKDYPTEFVGVLPFSREIISDTPLTGTDYITYGSTLLTELTAEMGWKGTHFSFETFNYSAAAKNRDDMMNAEMILNIVEVISFLEKQPSDSLWFIRPSKDLKEFSGHVIQADEGIEWLKDRMECVSSGSYKLDPSTMIVLAEPKVIQAEWRWFIVGRKVVSGAMYRNKGKLCKVEELNPFRITEAQKFADKWLPNDCCVMDLALVDSELKVIEFNCINSSGFYNHNINNIFKSLWEYHKCNF